MKVMWEQFYGDYGEIDGDLQIKRLNFMATHIQQTEESQETFPWKINIVPLEFYRADRLLPCPLEYCTQPK